MQVAKGLKLCEICRTNLVMIVDLLQINSICCIIVSCETQHMVFVMKKAGHPTDYKEKYCDEIIKLQSQGWSIYEVAREWNVSVQSIYEWKNTHKKFSDAFTRARECLRGWYDKTARERAVDITENGRSERLNDRTLKFLYYTNFRESENSLNSCVNLPELYYKTKDCEVKKKILDEQLALNILSVTQYTALMNVLQKETTEETDKELNITFKVNKLDNIEVTKDG